MAPRQFIEQADRAYTRVGLQQPASMGLNCFNRCPADHAGPYPGEILMFGENALRGEHNGQGASRAAGGNGAIKRPSAVAEAGGPPNPILLQSPLAQVA